MRGRRTGFLTGEVERGEAFASAPAGFERKPGWASSTKETGVGFATEDGSIVRRGGRGRSRRGFDRARESSRESSRTGTARELEREQERALLLHRFGEERAQDRKEEDETQRHSREPRGDDAVVPDEIHRRRAGRGGVGRGHARVRRGKRRATRGVALRREPAELASARFSPHRRTVSGGLTTIAGDEMQHRHVRDVRAGLRVQVLHRLD